MKLTRTGLIAALIAGSLALAACGSDNNSSGGGSTSKVPAAAGSTSSSTSGSVATSGAASSSACEPGSLKSDGSTAQQNAMTQWIKDYQTECSGATITYGGGGSGQGVTDFTAKQVDFAGSDAALDTTPGAYAAAARACPGGAAVDLPMVTGPIAIGYHLKGVSKLIVTPTVLAKIFLGKITTWNDPALAAINPGVKLPSEKITVFSRSDASGTTQNFQSYLKASAPSVWTVAPSKSWAGAGQGRKGNQLVGSAVQSTAGSIAYVEWSYAIQNNLSEAEVDNGAGPVTLSADSAGKTVATATVSPAGPGDLTLKLDYATKTAGAYPIVLVTYEIVCTRYSDPAKGALVKSFLNFIAGSAEQNAVHQLGYAALPAAVQAKVQAEIADIS